MPRAYLGARCRAFELLHSDQLIASVISLATSFFISLQNSSRAYSAAPRFQTGSAVARLRFGMLPCGRLWFAKSASFFNTCHKKSSEVIDFRGFLRIDRRYITVKSIFALLNVFCKLHQAYNSLHVWIICPTLMDHETNFISPNTLCRNGFRRFFASKYWRGFL